MIGPIESHDVRGMRFGEAQAIELDLCGRHGDKRATCCDADPLSPIQMDVSLMSHGAGDPSSFMDITLQKTRVGALQQSGQMLIAALATKWGPRRWPTAMAAQSPPFGATVGPT